MKMRKRLMCVALAAVLMCTVCGCARNDLMTGIEGRGVKVDADMDSGADAVADFGLRILRACMTGNSENVMISPVSVISALSMAANGARGETLTQLEAVFGMPQDKLREYLSAYAAALPSDEKTRLHSANSIWLSDDGLTVEKEFLQANADYFNTAAYSVPFDRGTLNEINSWVNENTDKMIPEIIEELDPRTVAVLVNALAFEGEWSEVYEKTQVHEREFTVANGTVTAVDMMYSEEWQYLEDGAAVGFMKPYAGGYAFAALLPSEGVSVSEYIGALTGERLHDILTRVQYVQVNAGLPKFECDYSVELADVLRGMGVSCAFDPFSADFTGLGTLDSGDSIYINKVLHKTHIDVFEQGTKAAAATAVVLETGAALSPEEPKEVILDRPFIYMIVDTNENVPVFLGTVGNIE